MINKISKEEFRIVCQFLMVFEKYGYNKVPISQEITLMYCIIDNEKLEPTPLIENIVSEALKKIRITKKRVNYQYPDKNTLSAYTIASVITKKCLPTQLIRKDLKVGDYVSDKFIIKETGAKMPWKTTDGWFYGVKLACSFDKNLEWRLFTYTNERKYNLVQGNALYISGTIESISYEKKYITFEYTSIDISLCKDFERIIPIKFTQQHLNHFLMINLK
jgi:hypothetical protein